MGVGVCGCVWVWVCVGVGVRERVREREREREREDVSLFLKMIFEKQCDQIWRNFATLANKSKSWQSV